MVARRRQENLARLEQQRGVAMLTVVRLVERGASSYFERL